ncbi:uncharacterized protein BDCG_16063 [Blastomyces dermatitidis ER-3]|uniref:Aminoglycoside phosphotransferase domain-containing protein n=1 Tax=Ajellomyces dermatitidis (strain ER-3 / ATCC MYA-2586) TaxID=559297 RepID=A0ABX2VQW6_AJEDR|nr:uncharacterized protein BDCG_16063 [Blastomyces dermatitidis ER-3]OAS99321.1 hypothetical protein BDCG_16063 [Blastomyces dermatitidis ER-3]
MRFPKQYLRQNFPFSPPITYGFANSSASSQPPLRILQLYHLVPQSARLFLYRLLLPIGTYLYGTGTYGVLNVQRLPFKRAPSQRLVNEARALELVAKHTTLNAPRVLDFIELPAAEECWMLTTRIEGDIAGKCLPLMDAEQLEQFSIDFRDYPTLVESVASRIDHDNGGNGPYNKIEDLNKRLMSISSLIPPEDADRALVAEVHSRPYRVFFTHADLKPGNVLVHSGRLSGFVDWEFAGWYPEYWEYSKACYVVYGWQLWLETMKKAFPEYPDEWRAERVLQAHTCPF